MKSNEMIEAEEQEKKVLVDKVDITGYSIYGIKIGDLHLSVDDVYLKDFSNIAISMYSRLQDDEAPKIIEFKHNTTGEFKEESVNREEAFHATALLVRYFKDRVKAINQFHRLQEARTNKMIARAKKVVKRREKKKLNKKFKK